MDKQFFEIFSLTILEPGTFISDVVMAFACYLFYIGLKKVTLTRYDKHCAYYFLFMAYSSLFGAFAHSFFLYTGKWLHFIAWILSGVGVYFMEYSLAELIKKDKRRELFISLIRLQLIVYVLASTIFMEFITAKINIVIGMLGVVFPLVLTQYIRKNDKNYLYPLLGILLAILPAFTHRIEFSFGGIFNMNDLSHFFIIFCQYLLFIGFKHHILVANNRTRYEKLEASLEKRLIDF